MQTRGAVLVSGAGVAGTTVAHWLHHHGWDVTVVERAPSLRATGQNIDVRGAGREVIRRMGVEERIARSGTGEVGTRFVDRSGRAVAEFPAGSGDTAGATAEVEILRGQLVATLDELVEGRVEHVYGDSVTEVSQDDTGVDVTFEHAPPRRFDLLVVAEGIRSRTRELVFGAEARIRDLGQYVAYGAIPRTADDDDWWRWMVAGRGRAVMLRPDNVGTTRASLAFLGPLEGLERLEPARQIDRLREVFADIVWQAPRILDALAADHSDFYLDRVAQVYAPAWSRGRIALVGDAAYCASPISGMGTSLALTGAYVLAGELSARPAHGAALSSYEALMRPYVKKAQQLPPGAPRIANPFSRLGVAAFTTGLRLAASRPGRALGDRLFTPPADEIDLPAYAHPSRA
jgi:2-polyprenyl-6-methoxyphenol hydroxylase-like FAD-dependent oxidoreductase